MAASSGRRSLSVIPLRRTDVEVGFRRHQLLYANYRRIGRFASVSHDRSAPQDSIDKGPRGWYRAESGNAKDDTLEDLHQDRALVLLRQKR
jgi:hypothetical protein